ncbi:serine kinase [Hylemonella gracilis str. Niagara R]|uniref:Homoserine kinase n=1 Tax=Hylemonella gracilis str. Niagara R TaxID=1458275 RepID=A0A016XGI7_9BURK|nr:homoserine kinase [Hylemonella gracilis]EYC50667.1 serine kinase [Hylemonella gracilis str. Niagara R]
MAVFTEVTPDQARELMQQLGLGELQELRGIQGGIENTNYFVTTEQVGPDGQTRRGDYVLTLFERLSAAQLPFYLHLMKHLARAGIPVPDPAARPKADAAPGAAPESEDILHELCGKPAAVVNRLRGASELAPDVAHCEAVGAMLARMHLAGLDYGRRQPNLRGLPWWNETVPLVLPHLNAAQRTLILAELAYQNHVAASSQYAALPRGPIHADLFRDNVMFDGPREAPELTGFFDFYFAGVDTLLFDLAVCLNDWCIDLATGASDLPRSLALLRAYAAVRPLSAAERALLPALLRAGALRFWISRLWDFYLPREASLLKPHDPTHFERVLRQRVTRPLLTADLLTAPAPAAALAE